MKILNKRELKALTTLSIQHITRLEKADRFPKRILLVPGGIRVGWLLSEVEEWLNERIAERDSST